MVNTITNKQDIELEEQIKKKKRKLPNSIAPGKFEERERLNLLD